MGSTEGFVHAMDGEALSTSGSQPNLSNRDISTTYLQPDFKVPSGNAETTSQTGGGKAETSSKPNNGEDAVDSSKPTTQVGGTGKPTDVDTISTDGFDQTISPTLSNAGTEAQSTATSHAAESISSGLEEADVVINLKTVASNNIDDGGNDLTTRQFTLYTGSTNDDMIPDQTRHNDLQDLTTQTTENMISKTDILTQDSFQTNDPDKETTIHMQTTTDNSLLSEGQASELNPSLPDSPTYVNINEDSPTYVNTNANNNLLGETKHPLSTQTMPLTIKEKESNSEEETSKGPTKLTWTDTTLDSGSTIEIQFEDDDNNQQYPATPEPDQELNINLAKQDLTPESTSTSPSSSPSTPPCICPTTSFGTTAGSSTTTTGTTTTSGDCLCPDIILGPAEVETATDLPVTSGGRRRREWDDDDLYVDDFDQKILKKMPFLKFY